MSSSPADQGPSLNKPPVARDDRIQTEVNKPVEIGILVNDNDPDGDKLKIMSLASPSQNVGVVTINENDTVTFFPGIDYAGTVRFSYTISDGEGNSDKAKVTVIIKAPTDRTLDQSDQGQGQNQDVQGNEHGPEVKTQHENQVDNKASSELARRNFIGLGKLMILITTFANFSTLVSLINRFRFRLLRRNWQCINHWHNIKSIEYSVYQ